MVKQLSSVRFDWTISVGNLLSIAAIVCGMASAWFLMKSDVRDLSTRMSSIERGESRRDADHDKLVELAADVKYVRVLLDKRSQLGRAATETQ